jgi:hypothetical protein
MKNQVFTTKNCICKQIFLQFAILLLIMSSAIAQNNDNKRDISGIKKELKADKYAYIGAEQGDCLFVYNKDNKLMVLNSKFAEMRDYAHGSPVKFNDKKLLDSLVMKIIAPHFRSYKNINEPGITDISILLYSGLDGNVCELAFVFPKDSNFPLAVLEKFEWVVLNSGLKIVFDRNIKFFKGSIWVEIPCNYSINEMQQKLKAAD